MLTPKTLSNSEFTVRYSADTSENFSFSTKISLIPLHVFGAISDEVNSRRTTPGNGGVRVTPMKKRKRPTILNRLEYWTQCVRQFRKLLWTVVGVLFVLGAVILAARHDWSLLH
jgi:hypothetical protein